MNALNLGTLFAAHLMCPRKMSSEELQVARQLQLHQGHCTATANHLDQAFLNSWPTKKTKTQAKNSGTSGRHFPPYEKTQEKDSNFTKFSPKTDFFWGALCLEGKNQGPGGFFSRL